MKNENPLSDRLVSFFAAMNSMTKDGIIRQGRDFVIQRQQDAKVLLLRTSSVFYYYRSSPFNAERLFESEIDNLLLSHPAYICRKTPMRFDWKDGDVEKSAVASADVLNYDIVASIYGIDLEHHQKSL